MEGTITMSIKDYESLQSKANDNELVMKNNSLFVLKTYKYDSFHDKYFSYFIDSENELYEKICANLELDSKSFDGLKNELQEIKSKWWYKLFNRRVI